MGLLAFAALTFQQDNSGVRWSWEPNTWLSSGNLLTEGRYGLPWWLSGKEFHLPMQEMRETRVRSVGREDALEKQKATHTSILAWGIPRTEEPGRL